MQMKVTPRLVIVRLHCSEQRTMKNPKATKQEQMQYFITKLEKQIIVQTTQNTVTITFA